MKEPTIHVRISRIVKDKKAPWFRKNSPALKNPKIIRGEILRWKTVNENGKKVHPDKGGDPEDMVILNGLKKKIQNAV